MTAGNSDPEPLLEGLFTSRVRVKILTLLLTGDPSHIHARELAKITGEHFNAVWQELKHLESLGVLRTERVGNRMDYLPNPELPLLPELRQLLTRSTGRLPAAPTTVPTARVPGVPSAPRQYPRHDAAVVFGETD